MKRGINRAKYKNSVNTYTESISRDAFTEGSCIFLSHRSLDKDMVREINNYILAFGIDTYFDENDQNLQEATYKNDCEKITKLIQEGLKYSTHILCLLSEKTRESWWVPYEIGYADKAGKNIATLKLKDISVVPEYLKINEYLKGYSDLEKYLIKIREKNQSSLLEQYNGLFTDEIYKEQYKLYKYMDR